MTKRTNPARRLHEILTATNAQNASTSARAVWSATLGIKGNDVIAVFRQLVAISELTDEIEQAIREIPNINHETYLQHFPQLRSVLAFPQLDTPWSEMQRLFGPHAIRDLEFCADKIDERHTEEALGDDELAKLSSEVGDLFTEVEASDIDPKLRRILLELLALIQRSINEYRIHGNKGLRTVLARALGELLLEYQQVKKEPEGGVARKVVEYLQRLATLLGQLSEFKALAQPAVQLMQRMLSAGTETPGAST
jgi:hypothetical protein